MKFFSLLIQLLALSFFISFWNIRVAELSFLEFCGGWVIGVLLIEFSVRVRDLPNPPKPDKPNEN